MGPFSGGDPTALHGVVGGYMAQWGERLAGVARLVGCPLGGGGGGGGTL